MRHQPTEKRCPRCGETKPLEAFNRNRSRPSGRQDYCKTCTRSHRKANREKRRAMQRDWRRRNPDKIRQYRRTRESNHPEKEAANAAVRAAVDAGRLVRATVCEYCGNATKTEGHHRDYSKQLEVVWLCHDCHVDEHWPELQKEEG